jgi:formylglycine-generating enzyme required for sulfatase activity
MVNDRTGTNRVNRGGSWDNDAANCRTANRNNDSPTNRNNEQRRPPCLSSIENK